MFQKIKFDWSVSTINSHELLVLLVTKVSMPAPTLPVREIENAFSRLEIFENVNPRSIRRRISVDDLCIGFRSSTILENALNGYEVFEESGETWRTTLIEFTTNDQRFGEINISISSNNFDNRFVVSVFTSGCVFRYFCQGTRHTLQHQA